MLDQVVSIARPSTLDAYTFANLYRRHTAAVFNYCLLRVGNRAFAEDLTADIFERTWRARRRYRPDHAAFSTWLFTIAKHIVTDWHRRQARRPIVLLDDSLPDNTSLPESQLEEAERQSYLRHLIRALNDSEQEIIALKFGAGMTNRHIAQLLGKSETAIGSAVHRVMGKLRTQWEETND